MADSVKFSLRESEAKDFSGGTTTVGDGQVYDFGAQLKKGNGSIETDDPAEIAALRMVPALKEEAGSKKKGDDK